MPLKMLNRVFVCLLCLGIQPPILDTEINISYNRVVNEVV